MTTLYDLKPRFQALLRPLVARTAAAGITPNQLTIAACMGSLVVGAALAIGQRGWIAMPIFLAVRMALNAADGMLAREYGMQTRLGTVLNELSDVISDAALAFPIAFIPGWSPFWIAICMFFAALPEIAGILGTTVGSTRRNDGPFGKSDRALALGILGSWLSAGWPIDEWVRAGAPILWIALCGVTTVNRIRQALV